MIQNQIKRTLSVAENLLYLRALLERDCGLGRTELAYLVCEHFGCYDARARAQWGGCLKALRELERVAYFRLPGGQRVGAKPRRDLVETAKRMPNTRLIPVCDREADLFAWFDEPRRNSRVELQVAAKHDRKLDQEAFNLFLAARSAEVVSHIHVVIGRQSAGSKKSKQKARPKRPGRVAQLLCDHCRSN